MYKINFDAADVDWQIQMLKLYPAIASKHFRPAMEKAAGELANEIEPNIPDRSGFLKSRFRKVVSGTGLRITAKVGFGNYQGIQYVNPLEVGAKPHDINPRPGNKPTMRRFLAGQASSSVLRWMDSGEFVFAHSVHHPGIKARNFMKHGFEQSQAAFEDDMERAMNAVVDELGK
jgi:hypothetical protein